MTDPTIRQRCRTALWTLAVAFVCLLYGPRFVGSLWPKSDSMADFFQEYASARLFLEGRPVYSPLRPLLKSYAGLSGPMTGIVLERNAHPPTAVLMALPFGYLTYPVAFLAWNLLSLLALAVSVMVILHQLRARLSWEMLAPAVLGILLCYPLRFQCQHGQLNLLLLLLIVGGWAADRSARPHLAGVLIGTATALKLFPALLFLPLVLRRRWDAVATGVLTSAGLMAVTAAVLGLGAYVDYVGVVMPHLRPYYSDCHNVSLTGVWWTAAAVLEMVGGGKLAGGVIGVCIAVSSVTALALVARSCLMSGTGEERDRAFAVAVTAQLLLSPISWAHGFLLLLLPAVLLWRAGTSRGALAIFLGLLYLPHHDLWRAGLSAGVSGRGLDSLVTMVTVPLHVVGLLGLFSLGCLRPGQPARSVPQSSRALAQPAPAEESVEEPRYEAVA